MTIKAIRENLFELLRTAESNDPKQRAAWLDARIIGLGFGEACGRCGGSGNYSFNAMDGTRCYGCGGSGHKAPKLSTELYARLSEAVEAGKLDRYIEDLRARQAMERQLRQAVDTVMLAWHGTKVGDHYDWQKAAQGHQPDQRISSEVNKPMCDAFGATQEAVSAVERVDFKLKKAATQEQREQLKGERDQAMQAALLTRDKALQTIADAKTRLDEILRNEPSLSDKAS